MNLPSRPRSLRVLKPPGCRNSPSILSGSFKSLSITITFLPSLASTAAKAEPSTPDPTMITSGSFWEDIDVEAAASVKVVSEILVPFSHYLKKKGIMNPHLLSLNHTTAKDTLDFGILGKSYTLNIIERNKPLFLNLNYKNQWYQNANKNV